MDSYYSSEEEIAWGPKRPREIKRDLLKTKRLVNRRHTTTNLTSSKTSIEDNTNCPANIERKSQEKMNSAFLSAGKDNAEKLNETNASSSYYTPNETFQQDYSSATSNVAPSLYLSALGNTKPDESCFQNLNMVPSIYVSEFQQTLVSNTIILSSDEDDDSSDPKKIYEDISLASDHNESEEESSGINVTKNDLSVDDSINYEASVEISDENVVFVNSDTNEEQFENSHNSSDAYNFNDTLEEVEYILSQGQKNNNLNLEVTSDVSGSLPPSAKPSTESAIPIPVLTPVSNCSDFKKPILNKPLRTKLAVTPLYKPSTISNSNKFKDIVSPVRLYIKNRSPHLRQNIACKEVSKLPVRCNKFSAQLSEENPSNSLPSVRYQPATKALVLPTKDKPIKLPGSIQKYVGETMVIKHNMRVKNDNQINRELDASSAEVDYSVLNCSNQDVSILTEKKTYIQ